jgi:hypothetical protein
MKKGQIKKVAVASKDAEKPRYEPTPMEAEAIAACKVAKEKRGPRLKVSIEGGVAKINHDHPDAFTGTVAVMRAMGTSDRDFFDGLMLQLVNAGQGKGPSDNTVDFMLAVIKGLEPRDQIETMLAAQMAAVHMASMTFASRLAHVDNIQQQDSAERAFNKLTRTFAAQVEALKRYRSGGEQTVTVQHVHVAEGGQAIVGNVSAPAEGVGVRKKSEVQPHALAYAPGVEMPRQIEAKRTTVPSAGGAGL